MSASPLRVIFAILSNTSLLTASVPSCAPRPSAASAALMMTVIHWSAVSALTAAGVSSLFAAAPVMAAVSCARAAASTALL